MQNLFGLFMISNRKFYKGIKSYGWKAQRMRDIHSVSEKAHKSHCTERESYIWIYNSRNQQFIVVQAKEKVGAWAPCDECVLVLFRTFFFPLISAELYQNVKDDGDDVVRGEKMLID